MFSLSVLAALGHLSQRKRQGTGDADSHASDIGHWLGMTEQKQGAGAVDDCRGGRLCPPVSPSGASRHRPRRGRWGIPRLRARRGDEGIAPYEKAAGNPCVGADAHIRPKRLTHMSSVDVRRGGALPRPSLPPSRPLAVTPPSRREVGADSHARVADWRGMTG